MFLFIIFGFLISSAVAQNCILNPNRDFSPFIIDENFEFPKQYIFKHDELFYLRCSPGTGSLDLTDEGDHVICKNGTTLFNIRTLSFLHYDRINCKPGFWVTKPLNKKCEAGGSLYHVGAQVYNHFVPGITLCFNENKLIANYVKFNNYFIAKDVKDKTVLFYDDFICSKNSRPCLFHDNKLFGNINLDNIYVNFNETLKKLDVEFYNRSLVRYPLAIEAYQWGALQRAEVATFFDYTNIVPMWFTLFNSWFYVMSSILSDSSEKVVYSGTLDVLSLTNGEGVEVEIYLHGEQLPVPKWIWTMANNTVAFLYNSPESLRQEQDNVCKQAIEEYSDINIIICTICGVAHPELKAFINKTVALKCPTKTIPSGEK